MNPPAWRLLIDPDVPGARNMARDVSILEAVAAGESPATLRLYGWRPPCLSLGRHQPVDAADLEFCAANGIDVVRRPTGGRALLHHLELTYSLTARLGVGPIPRHLHEAYRRICEPLVNACRDLGISAELTPGEVNLNLPGPRSQVPCFEAPAGGEVVVDGRKLIGSAMRAHGGSILQHGAILLDWDGVLQAGSMGLDDDVALRSQITTFAEQLGQAPARNELEQELVSAFVRTLEIRLEQGSLTEGESQREDALLERFQL